MGWQTEEKIDSFLYAFIVIRSASDLALAIALYFQAKSLIIAGGYWALCWIFSLFLFFGIRSETFRGRYGRKVIRWREPFAWWFCFVFLVLMLATITTVIAWSLDWHLLFGLSR